MMDLHIKYLLEKEKEADALGLRRLTCTARNYCRLANGEEHWSVVIQRKDGLAQWGGECHFGRINFLYVNPDDDWYELDRFDDHDLN